MQQSSSNPSHAQTAMPTGKAEGPSHGEHGHHVTSMALLITVFVALLVLTFITVAVTWLDAGALNVWIALAVAAVKGILVVLYFMHLRWDSPFNAMVVATSLLFAAILIGATIHDTLEYYDSLEPLPYLQQID